MLHCIVHSHQFRQAKIIRKTDILYKCQSDAIKVENVSKKFNGVIVLESLEVRSLTFPPNTFNIVSDKKLHKIDDKGSLQYRLRGS